jgi:hypothetical protein
MRCQFEIEPKYIVMNETNLGMPIYRANWDNIKEHSDRAGYLLGDVKEEELNLPTLVIATPDPFGSASRTWLPLLLF